MPFQPGNPGGPGRPRGSRNAVNTMLDAIAAGGAEAMVRKMVEVAIGGDASAARMVLNRVWSPVKNRPVEFELPEIDSPADLLAANAAVVAAVSSGDLTPEEATSLSALLDSRRRTFELLDHEQRLSALEDKMRKEMERLRG